jgi:cathepsin X
MKSELYKYGPISCGLMVTDGFEKYNGGIYSEYSSWPMINHEIAIVGWGFDEVSQKEYWIGRNSWGSYWGEMGFFRIEMHQNNLAVETDCTAGIPTFVKPQRIAEFFE